MPFLREIWCSLAISMALAMLTTDAAAQQVQTKHARVELLSNRSAAPADKKILLGVHFTLEKGWHIYWVNPGDSGQPPQFNWTLPSGWVAGEVQWQRPERLQSSPTIVDYGYRDDVLLMIPVQLPAPFKTGSRADIELDAKWLICREVCLPDRAHLKLSLPGENPRAAQLFTKAKKLLPSPWPKQWKAAAESRKDDFVLTIVTGKSFSNAEFFPLEVGQIDNAAKQSLQPTSTGAKLILKKSDLLLKSIPELRGLLVIGGRAYQMRAPVQAQVAIK